MPATMDRVYDDEGNELCAKHLTKLREIDMRERMVIDWDTGERSVFHGPKFNVCDDCWSED